MATENAYDFARYGRRREAIWPAVAPVLATAWLTVFGIDAVVGVLDAWLGGGTLIHPAAWRRPTAWIVVEGSLPVVLLAALSPRISKRTLALPLGFLLWFGFGALPFGITLDGRERALALAACQVAGAVAAFLVCRHHTGTQGWLSCRTATARPRFSIAYTAKFASVAILLLPLLILPLTLVYAGALMLDSAGGFLRLRADGVYTEERRYFREDKTVYLVGMVHVGDRGFYEHLFSSFPTDDAVILAEGVSDLEGRFAGDLSGRDRLAQGVGLVSQTQVQMPGEIAVETADVDAADLSPATVQFVNALMEATAAEDLAAALRALRPYLEPEQMGSALAAVEELLEARNRRLLARLEEALARYDHVVVPWGAAHMPGIEAGVLAEGFLPGERLAHRVVGFGPVAAAPDMH